MNPNWIEKFAEVRLDVMAAVPLGRMRVGELLKLRPDMIVPTGSPCGRVEIFAGGARIGAGSCSAESTKVTIVFDEVGGRS
jgi:flagellar motor switch/type III secretory pathway protein FliN